MPGEPDNTFQFADETIDEVGKKAIDAGRENFEKEKDIFQRINGVSEDEIRASAGANSPSTIEVSEATIKPNPKAPDVVIKNLRTFQGDVADAIKKQNASVITIAMAEQNRNAKREESTGGTQNIITHENELQRILGKKAPPGVPKPPTPTRVPPKPAPVLPQKIAYAEPEEPKKKIDPEFIRNALTITGSVLLILLGVGAVIGFYVLQKKPTIAPAPKVDQTIVAFNTKAEIETAGIKRDDLILKLNSLREGGVENQNDITYIALTKKMESDTVSITTTELFGILATSIPASAVRAFGDQFMMGMYSTEKNEPFLILKVTSFDNAFAGMLAWEKTLNKDIGSIFSSRSIPITSVAPAPVATATGTPSTTTAPATRVVNVDALIKTEFEDITIQNKDARVLKNTRGDDIVLYSFLDQNTILITSSQKAFHEILNKFIAEKLVR